MILASFFASIFLSSAMVTTRKKPPRPPAPAEATENPTPPPPALDTGASTSMSPPEEHTGISKDPPGLNNEPSTSTASSHQSSTSYIISTNEDFPTSIEALLALEKDFPSLKVSTNISNKGDYILKPGNPDSLQILNNTNVLSTGKTINLSPYCRPPKKTKMVLEDYPLGFPLSRLREHPLIDSASRLIARPSKEETRQVLVNVLGDPPTELQLGIFGTFRLREYYQEPIRCGKCQRFDHHVSKCRSKARCGVCSEPHLTDLCITKLKEGYPTTAKCPNCGDSHHAWNPKCPERLQRLVLPSKVALSSDQRPPRTFTRKIHTWNTSSPADSPSTSRLYSSAIKSTWPRPPPTKQHPSPPVILPSSKCTGCGTVNNSQDMEFLTTILQMGFALVGKHANRENIQTAIQTILNVKPAEIAGTSDAASESAADHPNIAQATPPEDAPGTSLKTSEPSNHTNLTLSAVSSHDTESTLSEGLSQRKRFRRLSSGSEKLKKSSCSSLETGPQLNQHSTDNQTANDEVEDFDLNFPTLHPITVQSSKDGTPPVIHIPNGPPPNDYANSNFSTDSDDGQ